MRRPPLLPAAGFGALRRFLRRRGAVGFTVRGLGPSASGQPAGTKRHQLSTASDLSAYKKYVQDLECYGRRSEKKMKNGTKLKLRRKLPYAKQPLGTVVYGYYACEYLRACNRFSHSWRQLKKAQRWWEREKVDHKSITQTIVNIYKFITDSCMHVGEMFFNTESKLAMEKYEKIRNWRTMDQTDYKLPDIF
ncbi:uncharacterized protein [Miscanthus floridulus]|uniref:uncharacterized protein n=1 Tax=Miscanthus floridulus TaxID=154761 RepID=UPI0034594EBF